MSYAGKNAYSAGKISGVLRDGVSGANRGYVLAQFGMGVWPEMLMLILRNSYVKYLNSFPPEYDY